MANGLYHIDPETGNPGPCSAKAGNCPFGADDSHFTSADAAREAYELQSEAAKAKALTAWKRKTGKLDKPVNKAPAPQGYSGHGRPLSPGVYSGSTGHGGYGSGGHGR